MMKDTQLKRVYLEYDKLKMMHTQIRSAELRISRPGNVHKTLLQKVGNELRLTGSNFPFLVRDLELTPEELKLSRQYNTDYCAILADNDDEGEFQRAEIINIYQLATSLQLSLTSRYY